MNLIHYPFYNAFGNVVNNISVKFVIVYIFSLYLQLEEPHLTPSFQDLRKLKFFEKFIRVVFFSPLVAFVSSVNRRDCITFLYLLWVLQKEKPSNWSFILLFLSYLLWDKDAASILWCSVMWNLLKLSKKVIILLFRFIYSMPFLVFKGSLRPSTTTVVLWFISFYRLIQ